ncbi:ATP-binding protein [Actinomadura craniellae]|uniref:ATP-binding protein n=1 Tax=Actinomadura craniellae TaxID=2231787 RepID=UPI0011BF552A|nr:ATP-binding protein [Actinomadura craniellae]
MAATKSAPGWARRLAVETLTGWGLPGACEVAQLVVSELVTNSVNALEKAAQQIAPEVPVVRFRLSAGLGRGGPVVTVEAWDQIPFPPVRRSPGAGEESGRGLFLVEAVAENWGWYWPDRQVSRDMEWCPAEPGRITQNTAVFGKVTWAVVAGGDEDGRPVGHGTGTNSAGTRRQA